MNTIGWAVEHLHEGKRVATLRAGMARICILNSKLPTQIPK